MFCPSACRGRRLFACLILLSSCRRLVNVVAQVPTSAPTTNASSIVDQTTTTAPTLVQTSLPTTAPVQSSDLGSVYGTLVQNDLIMADLLDAVGWRTDLNDPSQTWTVFAPINTALWQDLHPQILLYLREPENAPVLKVYLEGHIIASGNFSTSELLVENELTFQSGAVRRITLAGDDMFLDTAKLLTKDVEAENGVIHILDRIVNIGSLSQGLGTFGPAILGSLSSTDLLGQMNGSTFFVPTPSFFAFASLAAEFPELYHAIFTDDAFELHLADLMLAHTFPNVVFSSDLQDGQVLTMANGDNYTVSRFNNNNNNNDTSISLSSPGSNGTGAALTTNSDFLTLQTVLHALDGFLVPSFLEKTLVDIAREYASTMSTLIVTADMDTLLMETFNLTCK